MISYLWVLSLKTGVAGIIPLFNDGATPNTGEKGTSGILDAIAENQNLLSWLEGFLTTIIAAYYGVSAWRPSS